MSTAATGSTPSSLTATSADLNNASDAQIMNVEAISAAGATSGVIIDVSNQTDFIITGSDFADTITGTAADDTINAGLGDDTIIGFAGPDIVDGGGGTDTIVLADTSVDLNAASDAQIVNVENITAAGAASGVTIDLSAQSDGFTITGSDFCRHHHRQLGRRHDRGLRRCRQCRWRGRDRHYHAHGNLGGPEQRRQQPHPQRRGGVRGCRRGWGDYQSRRPE